MIPPGRAIAHHRTPLPVGFRRYANQAGSPRSITLVVLTEHNSIVHRLDLPLAAGGAKSHADHRDTTGAAASSSTGLASSPRRLRRPRADGYCRAQEAAGRRCPALPGICPCGGMGPGGTTDPPPVPPMAFPGTRADDSSTARPAATISRISCHGRELGGSWTTPLETVRARDRGSTTPLRSRPKGWCSHPPSSSPPARASESPAVRLV